MISIIKGTIWLAGILTIGYFVMTYMGYEINRNYFDQSQVKCAEKVSQCTQELLEKGGQSSRCTLDCVQPGFIIKK